MTMRFVDGKHVVWSIAQSAPGVRATTTARYEYRLADGELTLHPGVVQRRREAATPYRRRDPAGVHAQVGREGCLFHSGQGRPHHGNRIPAQSTGVEKLLLGVWYGPASCQGDVTFREDGTYSWIDFGPGSTTVSGKWSMRWDALPPTLVMTPTASTDKDYLGGRRR